MLTRHGKLYILSLLIAMVLPSWGAAQNINASISGVITDPSGAVVPGATLTLTSLDTLAVATFKSRSDGHYAFPNLGPGRYELKASATGFRDYVRTGIVLGITQQARVDVRLQVGAAIDRVEVRQNVSPLNTENATVEGDVPPSTITELPLMVATRPRTAASFVLLMPGVSTGDQAQGRDASINGGMVNIEEAT